MENILALVIIMYVIGAERGYLTLHAPNLCVKTLERKEITN
jgi:hypothetical protein